MGILLSILTLRFGISRLGHALAVAAIVGGVVNPSAATKVLQRACTELNQQLQQVESLKDTPLPCKEMVFSDAGSINEAMSEAHQVLNNAHNH